MRRFLLLSLLLLPLPAFAAEATGHWAGSIKIPLSPLAIQVDLKEEARGENEPATLSGTIDIPAQGLKGFALGEVKLEGEALSFTMPKVGGEPKFAGEFKDHDHLEGRFTQRGLSFPFALERKDKAASQLPVPPFPYDSQEVEIPAPGGHTLAGTLTLPKERKAPLTAVILLTGSGPQDRDESLFGHKPFLVIADRLTRAGYAVLRCDDRGVGKSTGDFLTATEDDFVADTQAQLEWLRAQPQIGRIGLAGHSEGGAIAPQVAVAKPDQVAFLILLAAPGVPMDELLIRQAEDINRASGASEEIVMGDVESKRRLYPQLKAAKDDAEAEQIVRQLVKEQLARLPLVQRLTAGAQTEAQVKAAAALPFRRMLALDPRPALRLLTCPVLALNGAKDLQVAAGPNLEGIRAALAEGKKPAHSECRELPGLNHLFQHATTGLPAEYVALPDEFAPEALEAIVKWLGELQVKGQ